MPKSAKANKSNQNKVIHPKSRKAHKLAAKAMHKEKLKRLKDGTSIKQSMTHERLMWFKDNMDESKLEHTKAEVSQLIEKYLQRFEDELEQINIVHGLASRKSKQHISRETAIGFTIGKESTDFDTCGLEVPDLCNARNLRLFKAWDGNIKYVETIMMKRIKRERAASQITEEKMESGDASNT